MDTSAEAATTPELRAYPIPVGAFPPSDEETGIVSETPPTTMTWKVRCTKMPNLRPDTYLELAREGISLLPVADNEASDGEASTDSEEESHGSLRVPPSSCDPSFVHPFCCDDDNEADMSAFTDMDPAEHVSPYADNFVEHYRDTLQAMRCVPPKKRKSIERIIAARVVVPALTPEEEEEEEEEEGAAEETPVSCTERAVGRANASGDDNEAAEEDDGMTSPSPRAKEDDGEEFSVRPRRHCRSDKEVTCAAHRDAEEDGMTHRELAVMFGLSESSDEAHFRLRDFRRSLLSKLSETHLSFIHSQEFHSHLLCDAIGRRKMTPREFAEKLVMVQFHYQLHNGRLPSFSHRVDKEAIRKFVGPEMAPFMPEVGRVAFDLIRRGCSIDHAVKAAQKQIVGSCSCHR